MIGAITGDIVGSPYEFNAFNIKTTEFPLFSKRSKFTDDTVMTCAVAAALLDRQDVFHEIVLDEPVKKVFTQYMRLFGEYYPTAGYGDRFQSWLNSTDLEPIYSFGNGSAMRVSPIGWYYSDIKDVRRFARLSAEVSHNHPEGIKGAESVACAIFLAKEGKKKSEIKSFIEREFGYNLDFTLDQIRDTYKMDATCQGSVPQAIRAFLEGENFEDTIRLAVSIGGDSDTIACITGSISEAYYRIPSRISSATMSILKREENNEHITELKDPLLSSITRRFESAVCGNYINSEMCN